MMRTAVISSMLAGLAAAEKFMEQKEGVEATELASYNITIPKDLHGFLNPTDHVAISFWIVSMAMVAATVFFLWEGMSIAYNWKTSLNVGALVTLIAAVHYFYMREFWVSIHMSPIVYRYIDWSLTVPLQMIEFFLILQAVKPDLSSGMFFRLLVGTVVMLLFGYLGEALIINPWAGFAVGMAGWVFILYEIFLGEAGQAAAQAKEISEAVQSAFGTMRFIVTRLVHLPAGLLLRLLDGCRFRQSLELDLQLGGFREQDLVLPGHLERRQKGNASPNAKRRKPSTTVGLNF